MLDVFKMNGIKIYLLGLLFFLFSCQLKQTSPANSCESQNNIVKELSKNSFQENMRFKIVSLSGNSLYYEKEKSDEGRVYRSGSTSKLVATVVILSLVDRDFLKLSSLASQYLKPEMPNNSKKYENLTLKDLLSFTSGIDTLPQSNCLLDANYSYEKCIKLIFQDNASSKKLPGEQFWYGRNHLQIAGLMAIRARGFDSWTQVFEEFKQRTGLFTHSNFDHPSIDSPMLAGGMSWSFDDYVEFLSALFHKKILSEKLQKELFSDRTNNTPMPKEGSPPKLYLNQDWHYGFGLWLECPSEKFSCSKNIIYSAPGLFGSYPFINFDTGYYGLIAQDDRAENFKNNLLAIDKIKVFFDKWTAEKCANTK